MIRRPHLPSTSESRKENRRFRAALCGSEVSPKAPQRSYTLVVCFRHLLPSDCRKRSSVAVGSNQSLRGCTYGDSRCRASHTHNEIPRPDTGAQIPCLWLAKHRTRWSSSARTTSESFAEDILGTGRSVGRRRMLTLPSRSHHAPIARLRMEHAHETAVMRTAKRRCLEDARVHGSVPVITALSGAGIAASGHSRSRGIVYRVVYRVAYNQARLQSAYRHPYQTHPITTSRLTFPTHHPRNLSALRILPLAETAALPPLTLVRRHLASPQPEPEYVARSG